MLREREKDQNCFTELKFLGWELNGLESEVMAFGDMGPLVSFPKSSIFFFSVLLVGCEAGKEEAELSCDVTIALIINFGSCGILNN